MSMLRFGPRLGATRTGTTVYEPAPGQAICPYNCECGDEEWLLARIVDIVAVLSSA